MESISHSENEQKAARTSLFL